MSISPCAWKNGISEEAHVERESDRISQESFSPLFVRSPGLGSFASGKKVERATQPARGSG